MTSQEIIRTADCKIKRLAVAFLLLIFFFGACSSLTPEYEVPYIPTPMAVVDRMLDLAQV